jgi:putative DNA primase/helicase
MSDIDIIEPSVRQIPEVDISFASFGNTTDTQPKMTTCSLSAFLKLFLEHAVIADKRSGNLWSPTVYAGDASRKSANVQAITALVLDVDDGTPLSVLESKLNQFRYVVHTSYSHTQEHPKYRIVLPLATPVDSKEWSTVWLRLNLLVDGHADQATKDPARMYFLPSKRIGAVGHFADQHEGTLISVADLPTLQPVRTAVTRVQGEATTTKHTDYTNVDDVSLYEDGQPGLVQVFKRCHFMQWASAPENQNSVSEPQWMAMLSNASRFDGGRDFAHAASCQHDNYTADETDKRLKRHLSQSGPITCSRVQSLGFDGCPNGGCVLPSGQPTSSPAGLGMWPSYFDHDEIPHPTVLQSFTDSTFPGGLAYANGEFHCYRSGAHEQLVETAEVEQPLAKFLGNAATSAFIKKLTGLLAIQQARTDGNFAPNLNYLCLRNGTLDLTEFKLIGHSPEHRLRTRLDVAWDPDAACPRFTEYLNSVFEPDADKAEKIAFVQQWLGYLLVPDTSLQKMLWLVGSGANGKSVLLAVVNALVGEANISHAMLDTFHQPHVRAELEGKLVNIAGEMAADSMINDGYVKAIVAGDTIEASRKYKPSLSFRPFVRLMCGFRQW